MANFAQAEQASPSDRPSGRFNRQQSRGGVDWAFLEELRSRIFKAALAILAGAVVAFIFRNWIFDLLVEPYERVVEERDLVFFRPTEAFSLFMRISLFGGFVLASPVVIYQLWAFVAPGLTRREKKIVIPLVAAMQPVDVSRTGTEVRSHDIVIVTQHVS